MPVQAFPTETEGNTIIAVKKTATDFLSISEVTP